MPRIALLILTALLAACAPGTREHPIDRVEVGTPELWSEARKGQHRRISTGWLADFQDPRMRELVEEAIQNNHNLQSAAHRLRATRESTIIGRANRLPSVNASGSTSRSYLGLGPEDGVSRDSYGLSFSASWEVDLWGRLRDLDYATRADYQAALADFRSAQLSLAVNTAQAWANLIEAEQQLAQARNTLADFEKSLDLIERRHREALLRAVDVQLGRNNVESAKRSVSDRTLRRDEAARSLQLLLGRYPSGEIAARTSLPTLKGDIPAGLPSELVQRRPDLIASQNRLFASAWRADAARKDLLPSLRLTGSSGTSSDQLRKALDPAYLTWSVASSLAQTIYRGGAPSAAARAALARNKAAVHDYVQDVLIAFREVESALQADQSLGEQEGFLQQEVNQALLAQRAAERDLGLGIEGSSVLEVLEAQRRAENAQAGLIRLRNLRIQNRLDLHLALGGDFETVESR